MSAGLVLNKTNNRTLRGAFGDDTADWAGKIIVDVSDDGRQPGKMVPALRVRIPPPKQRRGSSCTASNSRRRQATARQHQLLRRAASPCKSGTACGSGARA